MCLTIKSMDKNSVTQKTFYKVVSRNRNYLCAIYRTGFKYIPGLNVAKGKIAKIHLKEKRIEGGAIHVFANLNDAYKRVSIFSNDVIIPVTCHKKDFIACNNVDESDFAFTQIFISKEIYAKALKAKQGTLVS